MRPIADRAGRWLLAALAAVTLTGATGCVQKCPVCTSSQIGSEAAAGPNTVPLQVVTGAGGTVIAFVQVTIHGQGPYRFALDTGASSSVVDTSISQQLNLPEAGATGQVTGVIASGQARVVTIDQWSVGSVSLPQTHIVTLDLPQGSSQVHFDGLLGSDMLSRYGAITVDYQKQQLILNAK